MKRIFKFFIKKPGLSLVFSFLTVITIGTLLLKLPFSTFRNISLIDAIFTATSATCVTGLVVKSTGLDFTLFGKLIILILIQVGGLGIMIWAAFLFSLLKKEMGLAGQVRIKEVLEEESILEAKKIVKFIIIGTIIIEIFGAIFLFLIWKNDFLTSGQAIFSSIFHSISAFCNAGFSLFSNSLEGYQGNIAVNILFSTLIILGGLGFIVIREVFQKLTLRRKRMSIHSKAIFVLSIILILVGSSLFYFFEKGNLADFSQKDLILSSFFQSITARTAGFNTVSISQLSLPTSFSLMGLMFIGGGPGSTAGGIKVTTFLILILLIWSILKRKEKVVFLNRTIPPGVINKALVVFGVSFLLLTLFSLILCYTEKAALKDILFEATSAFGTVGLSTGLTSELSEIGKILISILILIGRIGPLYLVIIVSKGIIKSKVVFPEEKIYLG